MQQSNTRSITSAAFYIIAWLLVSVLLLADVLVVRQAVLDVLTAVQGQQIENSAVGEQSLARIQWGFIIEMTDRAIIIVGGLAAVSLSLYAEYYFRKGRQLGQLKRRIIKFFAIAAAVFVVSILIELLV